MMPSLIKGVFLLLINLTGHCLSKTTTCSSPNNMSVGRFVRQKLRMVQTASAFFILKGIRITFFCSVHRCTSHSSFVLKRTSTSRSSTTQIMGARYRKIRSSCAIVTFHFLKFCYVCILNNNNGNSFRAGFQTKTKRMIKKIVEVTEVEQMKAGRSRQKELTQHINLSHRDTTVRPQEDFYNY